MNPLAINIWIFIALAYILVSLTIWLVARFSPYEWKSVNPNHHHHHSHSHNHSHSHSYCHNNRDDDIPNFNGNLNENINYYDEIDVDVDVNIDNNKNDKNDNQKRLVYDKEEVQLLSCNHMINDNTDDNIYNDLNQHNHNNDDEDENYIEILSIENDFTLKNSFWFIIGTLLQQGSDLNPKV